MLESLRVVSDIEVFKVNRDKIKVNGEECLLENVVLQMIDHKDGSFSIRFFNVIEQRTVGGVLIQWLFPKNAADKKFRRLKMVSGANTSFISTSIYDYMTVH